MDQPSDGRREIAPGAAIAPVPAWVELEPYPIPATANPHFIVGGASVLLDESQIDLCGSERAWFYRRAEMVTASTGAERVAHFSVTYDPRYEHIEVHAIQVRRGAQLIDHTGAAFETMRREQNMDRLIVDGRQSIVLAIPDVREGDVVETAYTRYGIRKSLGGRHSAWIGFEWATGIVEVRFRQRYPKSRALNERGYNDPPAATQTEKDDVIDRRVRTFERPGFRYEPLTAPWQLQSASIQWSEWRDWAEVAANFEPLYREDGPLPKEIEDEIKAIEAAEPTAAGRAAAALRFVQSAIRYYAISMGEGGFTPRRYEQICETRYGDCKDKSKLFVAMARRLGLDAHPALVNTRDGYMIDAALPTGEIFDHCIVRLAVDGKVYWLDPTNSPQRSPLNTIGQAHLGWALVLKPGVNALERMADPPVEQLVDTLETVHLGKVADPVRYEWQHKFRGVRAEGMRARLARDGAVGVFKSFGEDIQRVWPKARVVTQEVVSDNLDTNTLTIREAYEIEDAWTRTDDGAYKFGTRDFTIRGTLAPLDPGDRKHAIFLGHPGRVSRRVDVRSSTTQSGGWDHRIEGSTLGFRDEMRVVSPQYLVLEQTLEIRSMLLPASESHVYRKVFERMEGNELVLTEHAPGGKASSKTAMNPFVFWLVVAACLSFGFMLWQMAATGGALQGN
jgi:transglutaminase-like putative cysteine protease